MLRFSICSSLFTIYFLIRIKKLINSLKILFNNVGLVRLHTNKVRPKFENQWAKKYSGVYFSTHCKKKLPTNVLGVAFLDVLTATVDRRLDFAEKNS